MTEKYNLFIGRWAPFHEGHKYIIDSFVNNGKKVCVAVRDTYIDEKNPFDAELRKKRIEDIYKDNLNVKVIVIPDIEQVAVGRGVGYSLVEAPEQIQKVSGTEIRKLTSDFYNNGKGAHILIFGLPCSGKTFLGDNLARELRHKGYDVQRLDGDIVRKSLSKDLGFSKEDRLTNLTRVAGVAKTLVNHGVIVISTFICPYIESRLLFQRTFKNKQITVFVDTPPEVCELRDTKGMWKKARLGEINQFTGVSHPFERPHSAERVLVASGEKPHEENGIVNRMSRILLQCQDVRSEEIDR